jgi:hypothetical protein
MTYDEGSLVLEFLSGGTNELIRRGGAADWIEGTDIADEASINDIVKQMLAKFPPSRIANRSKKQFARLINEYTSPPTRSRPSSTSS